MNKNTEATDRYVPGSAEDFMKKTKNHVYFGFDTADIDDMSKDVLNQQAEWLIFYPKVRIAIEGHCDIRGTREYNQALGKKRAESVRDYLIYGDKKIERIDPSRLDVVSYGKERPQVEGDDEIAHAQNRVSISVVN